MKLNKLGLAGLGVALTAAGFTYGVTQFSSSAQAQTPAKSRQVV